MQPRRFYLFCVIGGVVFVAGTLVQWLLIHLGFGATASYVLKGVVSIELSFTLNRALTWRERHIDLLGALVKWNAQKAAIAAPDVGVYALLVWLGMNWLVANIVVTGLFSVVNYVGGHLWSFRGIHMPRHRAARKLPSRRARLDVSTRGRARVATAWHDHFPARSPDEIGDHADDQLRRRAPNR